MSPEQLAMLEEIQALEFTCIDLNLFLDTHPCEQCALADYNAAAQRLSCLKAAYAQKYGPLTHFGLETTGYPWTWICSPWPWEIEY
ncbi:MAG: spore coat protein CotJB [Patescibacteria group bacterium]